MGEEKAAEAERLANGNLLILVNMQYETYTLRNKARVVLVPQLDVASMTLMIMYPVGSRYEPEKMRGVSHFIEHLMFKGTKKRKSSFVLTREIDRLGAEYNAFTGKEYTGYYIKTDANYTEIACDILSDMLFNSTFDAKEMEREKKVVVEEIRMYNDNPLMNIDSIFEQVMYSGHLGWDIAGTEAHVMGYKRDDVLAYHQMYYQPSNMTIVLAGNVTEKTRVLIDTYFGQHVGKGKKPRDPAPSVFGGAPKKERIRVQKKQTDQAQLMLGFPGFSYMDPKNAAVSVMNTILGGSMSSRLFVRIREKLGLAYTVRSGTDTFHDTGYVFIRAGLEAKNINRAIAAVKDEIQKMIEKGVSKRELQDAKTHIHGALTLSMEDSSSQASWYAKQSLFMDKLRTPQERLALIDAVTQEDVRAIAKEIFVMNRMRVGIIGDVEEKTIVF